MDFKKGNTYYKPKIGSQKDMIFSYNFVLSEENTRFYRDAYNLVDVL